MFKCRHIICLDQYGTAGDKATNKNAGHYGIARKLGKGIKKHKILMYLYKLLTEFDDAISCTKIISLENLVKNCEHWL